MTRQEARKILYEIHADAFEKDNSWLKERANNLLKYLEQPISLADFLGWEENVEYEEVYGDRFIIEDNSIYKTYSADLDIEFEILRIAEFDWCDENIKWLRQAKKVGKKETKEELVNELLKLVSSEKINEIIEKLRRLDNE